MDELGFIHWDRASNLTLMLDFILAIGVFTCLRFFLGFISHVNTTRELAIKDNPAFGISLAGAVLAISIVLAGAIYGEPIFTLTDSVVAVGVYGVLGIVLMGITRLIFDRIALPKVSVRDEILKGNVAAAVLDAGNMVATAIIIYTVMIWVLENSIRGVMDIVSGFLVSQILLTAGMYARIKWFHRKHGAQTLDDQFKDGNVALALRFIGRRIGIAFAIAAASNLIVYDMYHSYVLLAYWAGISVMMMAVLTIVSWIAQRVILAGVDVDKEVIEEKNIAIAVVQSAVYISLGMLLAQFLG